MANCFSTNILKQILNGEKIVFTISGQSVVLGRLDIHIQRINMDAYVTPYIKIKSLWIKKM